jgi:hypothetical protein
MHTLGRLRQGTAPVFCSSPAPSGRRHAGGRKSTGRRFDSSVTPTGTLRLSWEPLFLLGEVRMTPWALRALKKAARRPLEFLASHVSGYWGEQHVFRRCWNDRAMWT